MKIRALYFRNVGPLGKKDIDLIDSWTNEISQFILFSGPNGTGKSLILRMIAMLWEAAGYWLDHQRKMPKTEPACAWLSKWTGCAVVFDEVFEGSGPVGLIFGDAKLFVNLLTKEVPATWIGETVHFTGKPGRPAHNLYGDFNRSPISKWIEKRKKLVLTFDEIATPNLVYLDAEKRRWVPPKRGIGRPAPENPILRWLVRYKATEDWKGQLEASLITLKTSKLQRFHEIIRELNRFLHNKEIDTKIRIGENRLRVKLKNHRDNFHYLDDLSAGEHQVLIQLYLIHRWLQPGGVVLIDEPDLHLHLSLIPSFLASLESVVKEKQGQLLLTSHLPDIWERYESVGLRISLGGEL